MAAHLAIHFQGSISLAEIEQALHARGMHLREDSRGRLLAERVPRFLSGAVSVAPDYLPQSQTLASGLS